MTTPASVRREVLQALYGDAHHDLERRTDDLIGAVRQPRPARRWDERTAWVITYPGQVRAGGESPLQTVRTAVVDHLQPEITGVHVLPFHPSSSDGGFSVTDFDRIDPEYGSWDDLRALSSVTEVMADAVVNHASAQGDWFRGFLSGEPEHAGFFREVDPDADLSVVVRPRSTPIPQRFRADDGHDVVVWATFSRDQIDLDYRNPDVLLEMTRVVLSYVAAGAHAIRLDAVAFLWKEEGTTSIHLRETHDIIRFLRACVDEIDPEVVIVTETNVPHEENISYFGRPGEREAQAVYQFPLPPLVLHSFVSGSAVALVNWARSLTFDRTDTTFLNFLASHDGIGVRPVEGILGGHDIGRLEETCLAAGGVVNQRRLPDGTDVTYELTGTWFALLAAGHEEDAALARHLSSYAIALALRGVPLLYVHSLAASSNDTETFERTGHGRDLNRATFDMDQVREALADPASLASRTWTSLRTMLRHRASSPAFRPDAEQLLLDAPDEVVLVMRRAPSGERAVVAVNVSAAPVTTPLPNGAWERFDGQPAGSPLDLAPWSNVWLREVEG